MDPGFTPRAKDKDLENGDHKDTIKLSKVERLRQCSKSHEHLVHLPSLNSLFRWQSFRFRRSASDRHKKQHETSTVSELAPRATSVHVIPEHKMHSPPSIRLRPRQLTLSLSLRLKSFLKGPDLRIRSVESLSKQKLQNPKRTRSTVQLASTPGGGSSYNLVSSNNPSECGSLRRPTNPTYYSEEKLYNIRPTGCYGSCASFYEYSRLSPETPGSLLNSQQLCSSSDKDLIGLEGAIISSEPPPGVKIVAKRLLGHGANGICHEVSVQPIKPISNQGQPGLPEQAALKVLPLTTYQAKTTAIHREIIIQRRMIHPNLLGLYSAYHEPRLKAVCLLLEFCAIGTLMDLVTGGKTACQTPSPVTRTVDAPFSTRSVLKHPETGASWNHLIHDPDTGGLPLSLARLVFRGLMRGLSYMHDNYGIVHRDIKPSNILLADGFVAKLSDFGLACGELQCREEKEQICGSPNYLAPEVFLKEGHSKSSDCWAAGVTLYYMLCGRPTFQPRTLGSYSSHKMHLDKIDEVKTNEDVAHALANLVPAAQVRSICRNLFWGRYEFPSKLHQSARYVIFRLLQRFASARPSASQVLEMEFCCTSSRDTQRSVRILEHQTFVQDEHPNAKEDSIICSNEENKMTSITHGNSTKFKNLENSYSVEVGALGTSEQQVDLKQFIEHPTIQLASTENQQSPESQHIDDFVYTGNEAVHDAFKLLASRAKERSQNTTTTNDPLLLYWVSRWALTSSLLLYYTMDKVTLYYSAPDATYHAEKERTTNAEVEIWGVTNQNGQGLVRQKGKKIIQFEPNANSISSTTSKLPELGDVQTHCEFLVRQLKHFSPLTPPQSPTSPSRNTNACDDVPAASTPVFIQRWKDHGNNLIFSFSTGGWQANFYDHSKLIVHYPSMLVYTDSSLSSNRTFDTKCNVKQSIEDLEKEFRRWITAHAHLRSILQILLFTIL